MTAPTPPGLDDEFLTVCRQAVAATGAETALVELGWWDLLAHLDDLEARSAVMALFRAQGGALSSSVALGGLMAQPFLAHTGLAPGTVIASTARHAPGRGLVHVLVGEPHERFVLIDRPGQGASLVDLDRITLRPVAVEARLPLHEIDVDFSTLDITIPEHSATAARDEAAFLGRVALAAEILGAAERDLEIATEHAANRSQFGRPIGTFQAIRHLLAWGRTDCVAIEAVLARAVFLGSSSPQLFGEVVKALAGRNGRRTCERSLQVLGGIGFSAEHEHHHFHNRVLALDALLGSSAELTHQLGGRLRLQGDPGFPAAVLIPTASP